MIHGHHAHGHDAHGCGHDDCDCVRALLLELSASRMVLNECGFLMSALSENHEHESAPHGYGALHDSGWAEPGQHSPALQLS